VRICLLSIGTGHASAKGVPVDRDSELERDVELQHSRFEEAKIFLSKAVSKMPYIDIASKIPAGALTLIKMANALKAIVADTESVHHQVFESSDNKFPYFRFNAERDVGDIGLQDWRELNILSAHTMNYMNLPEPKKKKMECSTCLINPHDFRSKQHR
jgi:hypothetical protein